MPDRYPLSWPVGVPRTPRPTSSQFDRKRSMETARQFLFDELGRLGARDIILSTNIKLRQNGNPYSNQRQPDDKGVAVYFSLKGKPYCFPCDRWDRIECNVYAIAKHIEAMRGQQRWGVGSVEQAFRGYQALPEPTPVRDWRTVFGIAGRTYPIEQELKDMYRHWAFERHPDRGGSAEAMAELNRAYEDAKKELGF